MNVNELGEDSDALNLEGTGGKLSLGGGAYPADTNEDDGGSLEYPSLSTSASLADAPDTSGRDSDPIMLP